MSQDLQQLFYEQDLIMTRASRQLTAVSKRGFGSVFTSRTGRTKKSFKPALKRDRSTGEIWAAGTRAKAQAFILNHGQDGSVRAHQRARTSKFSVRQHRRRELAGSHHFGNAIDKVLPIVRTKSAEVWANYAAGSIELANPSNTSR